MAITTEYKQMQDLAAETVGPIKTAVITDSISRKAGGLFWSVRALSLESTRNHCEIVVYAREDEFSETDSLSWAGMDLCVSKTIGPRAFGYQKGLVSRLKAKRPDIIHLHGLWMYPSLANLRIRKLGIPYIISPHGMMDEWALQNSSFKKSIARFLYEDKNISGSTCLRALCRAEMNSMRAFGIKQPIAVIPNGIDLPEDAEVAMPSWMAPYSEDTHFLFFLGRIHPKKGLSELLSAWSEAMSADGNSKNWVLVISGWDQNGHEDELKKQASQLGIDASVLFVGPSFDLAKDACFRHSDAFILPSYSEGLPMAVLEAWSYGLPVVMTDACNLPEGFDAGAAIHISPDAKSISKGLHRLFAMSRSERFEMGMMGKDLVTKKFQWNSIGAELTRVYRWMLGQSSAPASMNFSENGNAN